MLPAVQVDPAFGKDMEMLAGSGGEGVVPPPPPPPPLFNFGLQQTCRHCFAVAKPPVAVAGTYGPFRHVRWRTRWTMPALRRICVKSTAYLARVWILADFGKTCGARPLTRECVGVLAPARILLLLGSQCVIRKLILEACQQIHWLFSKVH